jgi:hypothetical protein
LQAGDLRPIHHHVFGSRFLPCDLCGASVDRLVRDGHICDPERRLDYRMFKLRRELEGLDAEIAGYLDSPPGRFESWWAERNRPA